MYEVQLMFFVARRYRSSGVPPVAIGSLASGQPVCGHPFAGVVCVSRLSAFVHVVLDARQMSTVALCAAWIAGCAPLSTTSPTKPDSMMFAVAVVGAAFP